jgi:MFS family permease
MLITAAFMASFGTQFFFLTLYVQSALGMTPIIAGLHFLPLAVFNVIGNATGGWLATRFGAPRVLPLGLAIGSAGLAAYGLLGPNYSLPTLTVAELMAGFGQGMSFTAVYLVAGSGVKASQQGVASGMASTAQFVGGSVGLALLVDLLSSHLQGRGALGLVLDGKPVSGLVPALAWVFMMQALVAFVAALIAGNSHWDAGDFAVERAGRQRDERRDRR